MVVVYFQAFNTCIYVTDGFTHYWAPGPIPENYPEYFENIPYLYSRPMPNDIESVGIHSTSLALMSILHHDYPENYTKPVMTWLEVMRTTDYGYAGTGVGHLLVPPWHLMALVIVCGCREIIKHGLSFLYLKIILKKIDLPYIRNFFNQQFLHVLHNQLKWSQNCFSITC